MEKTEKREEGQEVNSVEDKELSRLYMKQ